MTYGAGIKRSAVGVVNYIGVDQATPGQNCFGTGPRRVGDTVGQAQRAYAGDVADRYLLDIYNLVGDPATIVK